MYKYNRGNIRKLLEVGFDGGELRVFCDDSRIFRGVVKEFSDNDSKRAIVSKMLNYADRKQCMDILLQWVKEQNLGQYERHGPYEIKAQNEELSGTEPIDDANNLKDVDAYKKQIVNHYRRLNELKERQALQGMSTDPAISIEIEDIEAKIEELQNELKDIKGS